jgi:hypothetical protein
LASLSRSTDELARRSRPQSVAFVSHWQSGASASLIFEPPRNKCDQRLVELATNAAVPTSSLSRRISYDLMSLRWPCERISTEYPVRGTVTIEAQAAEDKQHRLYEVPYSHCCAARSGPPSPLHVDDEDHRPGFANGRNVRCHTRRTSDRWRRLRHSATDCKCLSVILPVGCWSSTNG